MKPLSVMILLLIVAAGAGYGGYWYAQHHGTVETAEKPESKSEGESASAQPAEDEKPVVPVTTTALARRTISETVTVYGTVVTQPGEVRALSVPFESRVTRILVAPGQPVSPGTEVAQVESSPDALVALQEAKNAVDASTRDLNQTRQRFNDHLATNQELSQSQQALTSAKLKLDSLTQRGVGQSRTLKSDLPAIVSKVDVQEGQIVPAGTPLVELAAQNRIEVRFGVDPADAPALKPNQPLALRLTDHTTSDAIEGHVRLIEQRVDPATRLVPVSVSLPQGTHLLLDSFVTADLTRASADALVASRNAVLPDDDGRYTLFTVKDNRAVKHTVRVGIQSDRDVQVLADDLKEGDPVVTTGNYILTDGMQVEVKEPTTEPATEPAAATTQPEAKS
jgi:RND family efflux transporter MFP subunit